MRGAPWRHRRIAKTCTGRKDLIHAGPHGTDAVCSAFAGGLGHVHVIAVRRTCKEFESMAKPSKNSSKSAQAKKSVRAKVAGRTEVRNSPIPQVAAIAAAPKLITQESIALRAYEIWSS